MKEWAGNRYHASKPEEKNMLLLDMQVIQKEEEEETADLLKTQW